MRKTVFFLAMAFLAVSCYEKVVISVGDVEPVGVINAQLNTAASTHYVHLSVSRDNRMYPLSEAEVRVFVNGSPVATAVLQSPTGYDIDRESVYSFDATFRPGDEVRLEARQERIDLSATVTVPPAVTISSVDTSSVQMTYMGETGTYLQAKTTFLDLPDVSFYRVFGMMSDEFAYLDEDGNPLPGYTGTAEVNLWMETGFDPVISEGGGKTGGMDLAALLDVGNPYHCFSDKPFSGGACTIRPLFYHDSFGLSDRYYGINVPDSMRDDFDWEDLYSRPQWIHRRAALQVRSLDLTQYHYLKALEALDTYGSEMSFLVEPTTLPSNVEGGLGFVGIEAVAEYLFYEDTRTYPAMDTILY